MGNCEKCWDNPCICGWSYKHLSVKQRAEIIKNIANLMPTQVESIYLLKDVIKQIENKHITSCDKSGD